MAEHAHCLGANLFEHVSMRPKRIIDLSMPPFRTRPQQRLGRCLWTLYQLVMSSLSVCMVKGLEALELPFSVVCARYGHRIESSRAIAMRLQAGERKTTHYPTCRKATSGETFNITNGIFMRKVHLHTFTFTLTLLTLRARRPSGVHFPLQPYLPQRDPIIPPPSNNTPRARPVQARTSAIFQLYHGRDTPSQSQR